MRTFAALFDEEGICPLDATSAIIRYTAWLGLKGGTVAAESLQQQSSAINKYFYDHQHRQLMALGELFADARRGLELQQRIAEEDVRVALPAPVVGDILDAAIALRRTLQWRPELIVDIRGFRGALATVTNYRLFQLRSAGRLLEHVPLFEGSELWTAAATLTK
eukprot:jgi/Tetstr1/423157/TSEL_013925.t1